MLTKNLATNYCNTCEGAGLIKTDCSGKMMVASTIKEKLFNGKPILPIGAAPFLFIQYLWY